MTGSDHFGLWPPARNRYLPMIRRSRLFPILTIALFVTAACSGDRAPETGVTTDVGNQSSGSADGTNAGTQPAGGDTDPSGFQMGQAGWLNACTVVDVDTVESATGFTVISADEQGGCRWSIESVDPAVPEGSTVAISWLPQTKRQFDIQREVGPSVDSSLLYDDIPSVGDAAYWQGVEGSGLGEVWVQLDQISFRVVNEYATPSYEGPIREPMTALAAEIADSVASMDVITASGDFGQGLREVTAIDVPEGFTTVNTVIDDLAGLPLPDDAVLLEGFNISDRASQQILTAMAVGDTARFYLEALPANGYTIRSSSPVASDEDVFEWAVNLIEVDDPQGQRVELRIGMGLFAPTSIDVQGFIG